MTVKTYRRFPAEWEEQDAVLLAWPHAETDWAENLAEAQQTYCNIIRVINRFEPIILIVSNRQETLPRLQKAGLDLRNIQLFELPYNDTWCRDFGPLSLDTDKAPLLLDFTFNGWGNKFKAELDTDLTRKLSDAGAFSQTRVLSNSLVLEGGSLESDGKGTLLTTSACLLEKNRNPQLSKVEIEEQLKDLLGIKRILWLDHGALQGDDTDSHIDTLARFAPHDTIVFQGCNDRDDEHYAALSAMHQQLASFRTSTGQSYRLLELPWPQACHDAEGDRLPATYANFLIINGAVLLPIYDDPADSTATSILKQAFPQRTIIPVDCRPLIEQHGSLHCVSMQIFKGVLA